MYPPEISRQNPVDAERQIRGAGESDISQNRLNLLVKEIKNEYKIEKFIEAAHYRNVHFLAAGQ